MGNGEAGRTTLEQRSTEGAAETQGHFGCVRAVLAMGQEPAVGWPGGPGWALGLDSQTVRKHS